MGFRLTREERRQIEAHRRKGELLSECVRRILLDFVAGMQAKKPMMPIDRIGVR